MFSWRNIWMTTIKKDISWTIQNCSIFNWVRYVLQRKRDDHTFWIGPYQSVNLCSSASHLSKNYSVQIISVVIWVCTCWSKPGPSLFVSGRKYFISRMELNITGVVTFYITLQSLHLQIWDFFQILAIIIELNNQNEDN